MLVYWCQKPECKTRVQREIDAVIARKKASTGQNITEILKGLTLDEWESCFPLVDLSLRESIRLGLVGTDYRQNVTNNDIEIGSSGEVISPGAFAVFQLDDVHMNENVYTNPADFDPDRFGVERAEDKASTHAFVGWGSGRHPCLGQRFARLAANIICVHFVALLDFELCDIHGEPLVSSTAKVDRSGNAVTRPTEPIYIRCRRRTSRT